VFLEVLLHMEAAFNNGQFAFTGFQFPSVVPRGDQTVRLPEEQLGAPKVECSGVEDAAKGVGAEFVVPGVLEVPVVVPDRREGVLSGETGRFGMNLPMENSGVTLPVGEGGVSKKSRKRQDKEDELVSRIHDLVIEDVRAEVRAGFETYVKELRVAAQEVRVRSGVNKGLFVKGSHRVSERSRRYGKGRRRQQKEGELVTRGGVYILTVVLRY